MTTTKPCPGPGHGKACHWNAKTNRRGSGRCDGCRHWRVNLARNPSASPKRSGRNGDWGKKARERIAAEIALARRACADTYGIMGAVKVYQALTRAA